MTKAELLRRAVSYLTSLDNGAAEGSRGFGEFDCTWKDFVEWQAHEEQYGCRYVDQCDTFAARLLEEMERLP